jgi:hypothetical protein
MLSLRLALKETFEARHLWEQVVEILNLFLSKGLMSREVLITDLFLSFLEFSSPHLIHVVIVDILVFSLTQVLLFAT